MTARVRVLQIVAACALLTGAAPVFGGPDPVPSHCRDLLPASETKSALRGITPRDLARLRDIGHPDSAYVRAESPFGVSPDGSRIAFVLTRPDPDTNSHCRALIVLPLTPGATPRIVDRGGELITDSGVYRGLFVKTGTPTVVRPRWSPDGRSLAYLRRDAGVTQLWRVPADGRGAAPVTNSDVDVERFGWNSDGDLFYATRRGWSIERARLATAGRDGFLYDARIIPNLGVTPQMPGTLPLSVAMIPAGSTTPRELSEEEGRTLLDPDPGMPAAMAVDGTHAWLEPDPDDLLAPARLMISRKGQPGERCASLACQGPVVDLWFTPDADALLILRRAGWANERMILERLDLRSRRVRQLLATGDMLLGCAQAGDRLVCTRESAAAPRRVVTVSTEDGSSTVLFDPNPEFARLRLGTVRRLHWRNALGLAARGDLVLPPGWRAGQRLPLVIVQYHSDGFLRGGTGDEYPIFAFADRGFAVLSVEQPAIVATLSKTVRSYEAANAIDLKDWAERRSLLSSLQVAVHRLVDEGVADPARIGITGLSDGASTVVYALINSRLFAAAAISTCCNDPWSTMALGGPAFADHMRRVGYPPATSEDRAFWAPMAITLNGQRVDTPLLMQLADAEYLSALESYAALREQGQPVEMHVFPGEQHNKWQPAHRLAIYRRNLDWFDFWLRGHEDPDPSKREQYLRWKVLRTRPQAAAQAPVFDQASIQASTSARRISR